MAKCIFCDMINGKGDVTYLHCHPVLNWTRRPWLSESSWDKTNF